MNQWFMPAEYGNIHFIYGFCDGNSGVAFEEYQKIFPNHQISNRQVFSNTPEIIHSGDICSM
jgi:hypothetical protein